MKIQKLKQSVRIILVILVLVSVAIPLLGERKADAASFTQAYVRLDKLTATTATTGRVCVKPATAPGASGNKIQVTFPTTAATDYSVSTTLTNWAVNTTFESGFSATAMPITTTTQATSVSGHVVTWAITGNLTVGTLYCFNWTNTAALTTSSAGAAVTGGNFGSVQTLDTSNAVVDQTYWGATIISSNTDRVVVTATVAPYFTMTLSSNADTFTNFLSAAAVNTSNAANTITVDTNALNGWFLWVKDLNAKTTGFTETGSNPTGQHGALKSTTAGNYYISNNQNNSIGAAHDFASTVGADDYGLRVTLNTDGTGSATPAPNTGFYNATATYAGTLDPTQYRTIASSTGPGIGDKMNIIILANISNSTPPAADYTDTLTYIGAGQF